MKHNPESGIFFKIFKYPVLFFVLVSLSLITNGQNVKFTHQDTLRGSITKERIWWDLSYYHIDVKVNPADSSLKGQNTIRYKVLTSFQVMQIDLQEPMQITNIKQDGQSLSFTRDGSAYFRQQE